MPRIACVLLLFAIGCAATRTDGVLATPEPYAAKEGARILGQGGNAIDAAVCVGFVLAVTHPHAGNLGGGSFLVVHTPDGDAVIDAREMAPSGASKDMFLDENGDVLPDASLVGPLAAGVPGSVAGFLMLLERYGTMDREQVLEPAIRLAEDGFRVDRMLHDLMVSKKALLSRYPETKAIFLPEGRILEVGEKLRQPALAKVLRAIAEHGSAGFYEGWVADEIAATSKRYGGIMTVGDLYGYNAVQRRPLRRQFAGHEVVTMPPPSSGGVVMLQILDMVGRVYHDGMRTEQLQHLFVEASRRAFADRAAYFADPDFIDVPIDQLLDKDYVGRRLSTISMVRATRSVDVQPGLNLPEESEQTCHFSVMDENGFAVACTTTLNGAFGCGVTAAGVLLNNEMDDFTAKPGVPNLYGLIQSEKNAIEPGKRPLSSMTPTILLKDGEPVLVVGSPGGPTIISTVAAVIMRHLLAGKSLKEAVAAPRLHCQWMPDELVHEALPGDQERSLRGLGHNLRLRNRIGDVQAVGRRSNGDLVGASDPRGRGAVATPK